MDLDKEKELITQTRHDVRSFGVLYEEYYSPIYGYILRRTANIEIAEDITSEVFFKALNHLNRFQWRDIPFSAWLYRIASNEIANHHRRNNHNLPSIPDISGLTLDQTQSDDELIKAEVELERYEEYLSLHACILKLPEKYQEVIALKFFENKHLKEIGEILGMREGTVKSLVHRAITKLKVIMQSNATFSSKKGYL